MQIFKNLFKNTPQLLFGTILVLGFSLFFASYASAEYICDCVLSGADSRCTEQGAADSICVNDSFIENVINQPGVNFDLKDFQGNDLDTVKVTGNLFRIRNTKKVYFSAVQGSRINNDALDINIAVGGSEYSFVSFRKTDIGECSDWETIDLEEGSVEVCTPGALEIGAKSLRIEATNAIYAKYRWLGVKEEVSLVTAGESDKEKITFEEIYVPDPVTAGHAVNISTAGAIKGGRWNNNEDHIPYTGNIFAQPGWHQTGSAGSINLSAKSVQVGNINAIGYPNSGQLTVNAESAYFEDIALQSVKGWEQDGLGNWSFSYDLTKPANQSLTVNDGIKYFRARGVYLQAADDITDVNITASDRISVYWIYAYSGCIPGTIEEIEDYPGKEPRRICQVGNSGNINLRVTGEAGDTGRGIWINNGICNDAKIDNHDHYDTVPDGEDLDGGQNFTGNISLIAEDGLVYIRHKMGDSMGGRSIRSLGFHRQKDNNGDDIYDIHIKGRFIYLGYSIKAEGYGNYDQSIGQVFPEEVNGWPADLLGLTRQDDGGVNGRRYVGGANIKIEPVSAPTGTEGCNLGEKGGCLSFKDIYNSGLHPFAPNGGRVEIKSDVQNRPAYRVEAHDEEFYIETNAANLSESWYEDAYDAWYVRDGLRRDPNNGDYLAYDNDDFDNFCNAGNEYIDGADAGINKNGLLDQYSKYAEGLDGGKGGDVLVEAQMIQPYRYGGSAQLEIESAMGHAGRGGDGGEGEYCSVDNPSHVIPQIGYGGRGGDGGAGGNITFVTKKISDTSKDNFHCFTTYEIRNYGGTGGPAGATEPWALAEASGRMGTCDLAGWGVLDNTNQIPEIRAPSDPGKGGNSGTITLKPMPTDPNDPMGVASIYSFGGDADGGDHAGTYFDPPAYPYYCTGVNFNADDPNGPAAASKDGNEAHAQDYMEVYENVEKCMELAKREAWDCQSDHCGDKYPNGGDDYYACRGDCRDARKKAESQCQYTTDQSNQAGDIPVEDKGEGYNIEYYNPAGPGTRECYTTWDWEEIEEKCRPKVPQAVCMVPGSGGGGFTPSERGQSEYGPDYVIGPEKVGPGNLLEAAEAKPLGVGDDMINGLNGAPGGNGGQIEIDTEWDGGAKSFRVYGGEGSSGMLGQCSYISQPGDGGDGGDGGNAGSVKVEQPDNYVSDGYLYGGDGGDKGFAGWTGGGIISATFRFPHGEDYCRDSDYPGYFNPFWDWEVAPRPRRNIGCDENSDCNLDEDCYTSSGECVGKFACRGQTRDDDDSSYLDSCRTRDPFGSDYLTGTETVRVDLSRVDGSEGVDGIEASVNEISVNQASLGVCEPGAEDPINPIAWVDHETGCCDGIDNDNDGLTDCEDPDCEDECYDNPGFLTKGRPGTRLPDPNNETWDRVCNVVICTDGHNNDLQDGIDIEDDSDCETETNSDPEARDLELQQTGGCEEFPVFTLSWTYYDSNNIPAGSDPQTKYEVQVAADNGFNNLVKFGEQNSANNFVEYSDLEYDTQYWWRVMVEDSNGGRSEWASGGDFTLNKWPWPQFDYQISQKVSEEEWGEWGAWQSCNYTYQTGPCTAIEDVYDLKLGFNNTTQNCPNGCNFTWNFGDDDSSNAENPPDHIYPLGDQYTLVLQAEDKDNPDHACFQDMVIELGAGAQEPPKWREIPPSF